MVDIIFSKSCTSLLYQYTFTVTLDFDTSSCSLNGNVKNSDDQTTKSFTCSDKGNNKSECLVEDQEGMNDGFYFVDSLTCGSTAVTISDSLKNKFFEWNSENFDFSKYNDVFQIINYGSNENNFVIKYDEYSSWSDNPFKTEIRIYKEEDDTFMADVTDNCVWDYYKFKCTLSQEKVPQTKNDQTYVIKGINACNEEVNSNIKLLVKGTESNDDNDSDNDSDNDNDDNNNNKNEDNNKSEDGANNNKLHCWTFLMFIFVLFA